MESGAKKFRNGLSPGLPGRTIGQGAGVSPHCPVCGSRNYQHEGEDGRRTCGVCRTEYKVLLVPFRRMP